MAPIKPVITIKKNSFERDAWGNSALVCGIDEAGRGCLAGPVVAAAAIVPPNCSYRLLKDSKILTKQERDTAFAWITENCIFSAAWAHNHLIDKINIYQASRICMKKALSQLLSIMPHKPNQIKYVLTDAMPLNMPVNAISEITQFHHFPKGESLSTSIAAASIVAKVTRDRIMEQIHHSFPAYHLDIHKGYATADHIHALKNQGPSLIHRESFLSNFTNKGTLYEQQNLFGV